jgi:uncharacterized protein YbaP (TraB family)
VRPYPYPPRLLGLFIFTLGCLLVLLPAHAVGRFDAGLLWRIESGDRPPSYLFGTMHSDDPRVLQLPEPVQRAFDSSETIGLELTLDPHTLLTLTRAMLLQDGTTLENRVGERLYRRTVDALLANGVPEPLVARMKPWAAAITLMTPSTESGMVLDQVLYRNAVNDGKTVFGLETAEEQTGLFDSLSQREQLLLLQDTLQHLDEIRALLDETRVVYLAGDLKRLMELNATSLGDSDEQFAEAFMRRLVEDRNMRMVERMVPRLREGSHFFAVGALHLPGPDGLLELLSDRGFRITRVY